MSLCNGAPGTGLSPRVRGNLRHIAGRQAPAGSIPACAGEPLTPARHAGIIMVYPRVCGGTLVVDLLDTLNCGLSPRVRGNP